ncbi:transposase [Paenibacillus rhizoplanae]|uniref:transposase n=1 Tax=Paenibacillus rhizoplanae TaxID=1917181 RepID=UPI003617A59B
MGPEDKYSQIFEHLNLAPVLSALGKRTIADGLKKTKHTCHDLLATDCKKMENIEFVSALVRRLIHSHEFRVQCRFTGSDNIPSQSSYSRLIHALEQTGMLEQLQDRLVTSALEEGFVSGTHLAVDSSMVEAWDCQFSESASKRRAARREQKKHEAPVAEQLQLEHPETEPKNGERTAEETQVQQARSSVPGGKGTSARGNGSL